MSSLRTKPFAARAWDALASLKVSITCLALLMVLVVLCTLAQVRMGSLAAVDAYVRSFLVFWDVPGTALSVPVFPGGALVGLVLTVNLVAAQLKRLELSARKAGLWVVHAGLILLFAGEFGSAAFQVEMQLPIQVGETVDHLESPRDVELALADTTDAGHDDVYGIPESLLAHNRSIAVTGTPFVLEVMRYSRNADLRARVPTDPPSSVDVGIGAGVTVRDLPPVTADDRIDQRAVVVEVLAGGQSRGTWLLSNGLDAPQSLIHEGRTWTLSLRARRRYLPYSLTLEKFSHELYPGTDIPKNFSSLVHLSNRAQGEERDVLISMNQPLRYAGNAFYQASFGDGDKLSILQVVENPGWLIPYISCVLVGGGLLLHFALSLGRALRRRRGDGGRSDLR